VKKDGRREVQYNERERIKGKKAINFGGNLVKPISMVIQVCEPLEKGKSRRLRLLMRSLKCDEVWSRR
jgi:hypothetical protein